MRAPTLLFLSIWIIFTSCSKPDPTDYRDQWTAEYTGVSYHWTEQPVDTVIVYTEEEKTVRVDVQKDSSDSALTLTYNDTIIYFENDLKVSAVGHHFDQWGSGSDYGSLTIHFEPDSLHYQYLQKCGIPCNSGIYFNVKQK